MVKSDIVRCFRLSRSDLFYLNWYISHLDLKSFNGSRLSCGLFIISLFHDFVSDIIIPLHSSSVVVSSTSDIFVSSDSFSDVNLSDGGFVDG